LGTIIAITYDKAKPFAKLGRKATDLIGAKATDLRDSRVAN